MCHSGTVLPDPEPSASWGLLYPCQDTVHILQYKMHCCGWVSLANHLCMPAGQDMWGAGKEGEMS